MSDSNRRPDDYKSTALPTELNRPCRKFYTLLFYFLQYIFLLFIIFFDLFLKNRYFLPFFLDFFTFHRTIRLNRKDFIMRSLAIDTASNLLSIALAENETIVASESIYMERGQGETLIPLIQSLCNSVTWDIASLNQVIVAVGPGSFTGVRIALAAARGIGLSLDIPVKGLTNFDILIPEDVIYPLCVALDTKRGDFYTQQYESADLPPHTPCIMNTAKIAALNIPVITDKPDLFAEQTGMQLIATPQCPATNMIRIANQHKNRLLPPEPVYLREADVTVVCKKS